MPKLRYTATPIADGDWEIRSSITTINDLGGEATADAIAKFVGVEVRQVRTILSRLESGGLIQRARASESSSANKKPAQKSTQKTTTRPRSRASRKVS